MPSTHRNMTHKDFSLITSPHSSFVQMKSKIVQGKIKLKNDTSQKLMRGDLLFGKISLGFNFPLS
jgi:hypothetical protein